MENVNQKESVDSIVFELWAKHKHFLPWIVLSIAVGVGIGYAYVNLPPKIFIIAFLLVIAIPVCVIWAKENLNAVIRGKNDLEGLSVPLLGVIASADTNETFRMVRTSMDAACGKDKKLIMFTSFEPGCGKTFVALNLATSFAQAGKKIALVDVDMRTAALSKMSELPEGLDVFPTGSIPLNPTELLVGDQFRLLLEKLRAKYDYVFLDGTPLDICNDAEIVSKLVDLSVFIVRENYTVRRKLREIEKLFTRGQRNKKELSDQRKDLEEHRRKEEQEINFKEKYFLEQYDLERQRIYKYQNLNDQRINREQKKIEELKLKAEREKLDRQKKYKDLELYDDREKLKEQIEQDKQLLNDKRVSFEEIALIFIR